jgi:hypothetical protein
VLPSWPSAAHESSTPPFEQRSCQGNRDPGASLAKRAHKFLGELAEAHQEGLEAFLTTGRRRLAGQMSSRPNALFQVLPKQQLRNVVVTGVQRERFKLIDWKWAQSICACGSASARRSA